MQAAFDLKPHVTKMLKAETYQKRLCQGYCLVWVCVLSCSSKSTAGGWEYQAPTANYSAATRPLTHQSTACLPKSQSQDTHSGFINILSLFSMLDGSQLQPNVLLNYCPMILKKQNKIVCLYMYVYTLAARFQSADKKMAGRGTADTDYKPQQGPEQQAKPKDTVVAFLL